MLEKVKIKDAPIGAVIEVSDGSVGYVTFPFDVVTDPYLPPLDLDPDTVVTVLITPTEFASKWINSYNYEIAKPITPARRLRYLVTASLFLLVFGSCTGLTAILLIAAR